MRLDPKTAPTTERCKIKAVNPPFRSVSTPRRTKDLRAVGPVNPDSTAGALSVGADISDWNPQKLTERLRTELAPNAWKRLVCAAASHQTSVEQLLGSSLSEVA